MAGNQKKSLLIKFRYVFTIREKVGSYDLKDIVESTSILLGKYSAKQIIRIFLFLRIKVYHGRHIRQK